MVHQDFWNNSAYSDEALQRRFPASMPYNKQLRNDCSWTFRSLIKTHIIEYNWKLLVAFSGAKQVMEVIMVSLDELERLTMPESVELA